MRLHGHGFTLESLKRLDLLEEKKRTVLRNETVFRADTIIISLRAVLFCAKRSLISARFTWSARAHLLHRQLFSAL